MEQTESDNHTKRITQQIKQAKRQRNKKNKKISQQLIVLNRKNAFIILIIIMLCTIHAVSTICRMCCAILELCMCNLQIPDLNLTITINLIQGV